MTEDDGVSITQGSCVEPRGGQFDAECIRGIVAFRGDVTLRLTDDVAIEAYVYDVAALDTPQARLRVLPADGSPRRTIELADIAAIEVSGRDTAAGRSFETWLRTWAASRSSSDDSARKDETAGAHSSQQS